MKLILALFAACLALAAPAWAGQRAVYLDKDGKKLSIAITDDGNATVRSEDDDKYGIIREGHFYLVGPENGVLHVARVEDMVAAFDKALPPIFKEIFGLAGKDKPKSALRVVPGSKRKVAGYEGQVYQVYGLEEGKPDKASVMVMSRDPALQPVGRVFEQFMISTLVALSPLLGEMSGEMAADMHVIFSYGAPLDMEGQFKLVSVTTTAVPPAEAALPAQPDTLEQIIASMKIGAAEAPAEPKE